MNITGLPLKVGWELGKRSSQLFVFVACPDCRKARWINANSAKAATFTGRCTHCHGRYHTQQVLAHRPNRQNTVQPDLGRPCTCPVPHWHIALIDGHEIGTCRLCGGKRLFTPRYLFDADPGQMKELDLMSIV